ncbi:uncharacterized protein LTR77_001533 [Saxophila tyrrhenica]|uniref:Extracellular membrane protein CFEM domain-containing protein n=1 Tax=Saxophila tyrrhenica TaxID=1690608 RepID=A0AAV9PKD7_9PEZI|nr:hypothetical protein LTR77_001533 [Saxophila tyrrhenica]
MPPTSTTYLRGHTLIIAILTLTRLATAVQLTFPNYPPDALPCLYGYAGFSGCVTESPTTDEIWSCLCWNIDDFIGKVGWCLRQHDSADVQTVWEHFNVSCTQAGAHLHYTAPMFINGPRRRFYPGDWIPLALLVVVVGIAGFLAILYGWKRPRNEHGTGSASELARGDDGRRLSVVQRVSHAPP